MARWVWVYLWCVLYHGIDGDAGKVSMHYVVSLLTVCAYVCLCVCDVQRVDFDHGAHWLGHRMVVHWEDDSSHYPAIIDDYDNVGKYHLIYDDGYTHAYTHMHLKWKCW